MNNFLIRCYYIGQRIPLSRRLKIIYAGGHTMKVLNGYIAAFAEGPFWDQQDERLLYVDLPNMAVIQHDIESDTVIKWYFETPITAIIKHDDEHYIFITNQKLIKFNKFTEEISDFYVFDNLEEFHLLNDAKLDSRGNIWMGTVDDRFKYFKESPITALKKYPYQPAKFYRLSKNKVLTEFDFPITLSNGIAFNEAENVVYHVDSATQAIWKLEFDVNHRLINRTKFFECDQLLGFPDGITIDENGDLWVPLFKSSFIVSNYDKTSKMLKISGQTGAIIEEYEFAISHITSCQFGGGNLQYLFVTTANDLLGEKEKELQQDAGKIHVFEVGVNGLKSIKSVKEEII